MEFNKRCPVCAVDVEEDKGGVVCDGCGAVTCGQRHLKRHTFSEGGCLPFRVEKDEERGRHFIATRDIKALEVVLEDWFVI